MGTSLTGLEIKDTYEGLIKTTDNGPLSGTAKFLSDGLGNDSALALSTTAVGIGTTSSSLFGTTGFGRVLGVVASSNYAVVQVGGAAASGGEIDLGAGSIRQGAVASLDGSSLAFYTNPTNAGNGLTERMLITSAGNVGIGTSAPSRKLVVFDTDVNVPTIGLRTDGSGILTSNGFDLQFASNNVFLANRENGFMSFLTGNVERVRIQAAGGISFNGDTAAANALDDYEEGDFTPSFTFGGAAVAMTFAENTGTYTKIGRQVTVNGYVALSNKGTSTGIAEMIGLPFTNGSGSKHLNSASIFLGQSDFANQFMGFIQQNTTKLLLFEVTEGGVVTNLTNADFKNNTEIIFTATYFV